MQIYEDLELNEDDKEIIRLSRIDYGIPILELLNVTKFGKGFKIRFKNKTNERDENGLEKIPKVLRGDTISILGKTYPTRIKDFMTDQGVRVILKRAGITLIVPEGFMKCVKCGGDQDVEFRNGKYLCVECTQAVPRRLLF